MTLVLPSIQLFFDRDGDPLDLGSIYIGEAGLSARENPIAVYWDADLTQTAAQPIHTSAGYPTYQGAPSALYIAETDCSITTLDRFGRPILVDIAGVLFEGSSSDISFRQSGTGAVVRTGQNKMRDIISLKDFGATGTGSTADNTGAFIALGDSSTQIADFTRIGDGTCEIYIPAGIYRITDSGLFNTIDAAQRRGLKIIGAGRGNTILWLDCRDNVEKYFYDNASSKRMWGATFEGITFSGGDDWHTYDGSGVALGVSNLNTYAKGFKVTGDGWESAFHFIDCEFRWLDQVFETAGANNADTHIFTAVNFFRNKDLFYQNNPQAFSISLSDCYAEINYGSILDFGSNATSGGSFNWKGGAIIQQTGIGSDTWVVRCVDGGPDDGNSNISFWNLHIELRSSNTHLYKNCYTGFCTLAFEQCNILNTATGQKEYGETSGYNTTVFRDTVFKEQGSVTGYHIIAGNVGGAASARRGKQAALRFLGACELQTDFYDADAALATALSAIKATKAIVWKDARCLLEVDDGCSSNKLDLSAQPRIEALACCVPGLVNDSYTVGRSAKKRSINPLFSATPVSTTTGTQCLLPPFVTISRAWIRLNGAGLTSGANVRLNISNGDKSVLYGQNTATPINTAGGHYLSADIDLVISDDTISRTITVWVDDGAGANPNSNVTAGVMTAGIEYA